MSRLEIEQSGQVADARLEIDESAAVVIAGQYAGQVGRQGAGAAAAGSAEQGDHLTARLPRRLVLDLHAQQHRLQLGFQVGFIQIMIGAFVQRPQDELGIGGHPDGKDRAAYLRTDFAQQIQGVIGKGRQNDHQHTHADAGQRFLGLIEGNQLGFQTFQAGL